MTLPASHDERKPNNGVGWMVTANWLCNTNTAVHGERERTIRSYQRAKLRHISLPVREAKTCQNLSMILLIPREDLFRNLHFKEPGQRENNFVLARTRIQSLYSDILYHMYLYCGVRLLFFILSYFFQLLEPELAQNGKLACRWNGGIFACTGFRSHFMSKQGIQNGFPAYSMP